MVLSTIKLDAAHNYGYTSALNWNCSPISRAVPKWVPNGDSWMGWHNQQWYGKSGCIFFNRPCMMWISPSYTYVSLYIYIYIYLQPSFAGTHISWMGDNSFLDLLEDYVINKSSYPIPLQWKLPRGNFPLKHQSLVGGDWNHGILGCSIREESSQLDELHHFPEGFKPPTRLTLAFSIPRLMTPDGRCSLNYTQFDYPFQSLFIIMCI